MNDVHAMILQHILFSVVGLPLFVFLGAAEGAEFALQIPLCLYNLTIF